jgi:hypothetical protein
VNNELVKLWKEMVTLYFQLRSHHSSDGAQTKHRSSQKLQWNSVSPEFEGKVPLTKQQYLSLIHVYHHNVLDASSLDTNSVMFSKLSVHFTQV